jgi:hypothetical protein
MVNHIAQKLAGRVEHEWTGIPLVLLVGVHGVGKTRALLELAAQTSYPYLNLNLELSARLLPLPARRRPLRVSRLVEDLTSAHGRPLLLDHLELLFDPALQVDPLQCLVETARAGTGTIVANWSGDLAEGRLTYAELGHPEYRCYDPVELLGIGVEQVA